MLPKQYTSFMLKNIFIFSTFFGMVLFTFGLAFFTLLNSSQLFRDKNYTVLLSNPWHITENKKLSSKILNLDPKQLRDKDTFLLTYNLHGICLLGDIASRIQLIDTHKSIHETSLIQYGKNCYDGQQKAILPFSKFSNYTKSLQFTQLHMNFWYPAQYTIDIKAIAVINCNRDRKACISFNASTPALLNPVVATVSSVPAQQSWAIQSVSSMKETKDRVCNQRSQSFIEQWVATAKDLGVNYISVETPYDSPACGDSVAYTKEWISVIRSYGLHVWHRHSFLNFEGIYNEPKNPSENYLQMIAGYIKANPDLFQPGDIFTPIPEPQNGGISQITECSQNTCMFSSAKDFNQWLRNAMDTSQNAFTTIGLSGRIKVGYFGFDGYVTWGSNNPNWHGILEDETIAKMGNITIDHYPEIVGSSMEHDLDTLQKKYPGVPIIIGEWGTIIDGNAVQQVIQTMSAAKRKNVIGFNYWQMGIGGNEALINEDFTHRPQYDFVKSFYKINQ